MYLAIFKGMIYGKEIFWNPVGFIHKNFICV